MNQDPALTFLVVSLLRPVLAGARRLRRGGLAGQRLDALLQQLEVLGRVGGRRALRRLVGRGVVDELVRRFHLRVLVGLLVEVILGLGGAQDLADGSGVGPFGQLEERGVSDRRLGELIGLCNVVLANARWNSPRTCGR